MDIFKIQISDEAFTGLCLQRKYLTEAKLEACKKIQQHLREKAEGDKKLPEVFYLVEVLSSEEKEKLKSFYQFINNRLQGIVLCQIGIQKRCLSDNILEMILITQRAVFLLKNKTVPIEELLTRQSKLAVAEKEDLLLSLSQMNTLEYEDLFSKSVSYLLEEDQQDQQRRGDYQQGLLGIKYATSTPPPSKLEASPEQTELTSPVPKSDSPAQLKQPELTQPAPKWEGPALELTPPASKLDIPALPAQTGTSSKPESFHSAPPSRLQDIFDIEATEPFQKPPQRVQKHTASTSRYAIAATTIIVLGGLGLMLWGYQSPRQKMRNIEYLLEAKEYVEAENKCREFRSKSTQGPEYEKVTLYLQQILKTQADIAQRQGRLNDAQRVIQEALALTGEEQASPELQSLAKDISQAVELAAQKERLTQKSNTILALLRKGELKHAKAELNIFKSYAREAKAEELLTKITAKVNQAEREKNLQSYHYYPLQEIARQATFATDTQKKTYELSLSLTRLPLSGYEKRDLFTEAEGLFFTLAAGHLYALKAATGEIVWVEYLGSGAYFYPIFIAGWHEYFNMSLVDKVLAVAPAKNVLRLLAASDGERIWETAIPGMICQPPVLHKTKLYAACVDHYCYQIELTTGRVEGAYLMAGVPEYAPAVDRRKEIMYIECRGDMYGYHLPTGKVVLSFPVASKLAATPLAVTPNLCLLDNASGKTNISLYSLLNPKEPELIQSLSFLGNMTQEATMAGGMLALTSNSHFGLFGVNPANPSEAIFPLSQPLPLGEGGPAFLRFTNFLRYLLLAQKDISLYKIHGFNDAASRIEKVAVWQNPVTQPSIQSYLPIAQCGSLFFLAQHTSDEKYFQATCVKIDQDTIRLVWQKQLAPSVNAEPLLTPDHRLIFTTGEGNLHEVYIKASKEICYRPLALQAGNSEISPVWVDRGEGELLVVKGRLQLLDAVTGWEKNWKSQIALPAPMSQPAVALDTVFVGSKDGVFALALANGQRKCLEYTEFRGQPFNAPLVCYQDTVLAGCDNGEIYQLKIMPGPPSPYLQKIWSFATQGPIRSKPLLADDRLYVGSGDFGVYALDLKTHELAWKYSTAAPVYSTPALWNDILYVGSDDRCLHALDSKTGRMLWKSRFYGKIRATPLLHKQVLYVASVAGDFRAYESKEGKLLSILQLGGAILSSPLALKDKIFLGSTDGFIYCIEETR